MLTAKIMVFCMNYLLDKQEEEKLECLCKLLTTIGEQVESEVKEPLDAVFKRMQNIVDRRGGGGGAGGGGGGGALSSRVRFMLQDVIALRRRRWAPRAAVHHAQPTTMDRIQREADLHHRNIELMNSMPLSGGYGRREEEGGARRGARGEGRGERRGAGAAGGDGEWKSPRPYTVDVSKIKAGSLKNLSNIKLAPQHSGWNHGARSSPPAPVIGIRNDYSLLENSSLDPASLRSNSEALGFRKGSSEKSTKADSE
ncbi:PREDICTED: eukaryotic translation initiation factor 4 gamma 1-like [Papilio xuthus]|uniref:Eukaryotic translation initiation factor 4 gamma 1-like n=1 Tax=Papilio xuthus TaxID=66420 RepID=A0AAJ7EEM2_PAPXU|nr:PREDICTED: eukaryotic translation initiation factor 4 gamma 1-like [Papilio xuthus]